MRGALLALFLCVCASIAAAGCGGHQPPPATKSPYSEPHWQDVFETLPELMVVVRPGGLKRDKVYGPLFRRAIDVVRERSRVVTATRALDAAEDADEVIVGLRPESPNQPGESVFVLLGVRADTDPAKLVDADGRPLWSLGPAGRVRELVRERDDRGKPVEASLFELPGRVWVIAAGGARARARETFAHPFNRPQPDLDRDALAIVRVDGTSLVARWPLLQAHGALDAAGRRLQSVTLVLPPGSQGAVRATLSYGDEDAAAFAEVALRGAVETFVRRKPEGMAWLGTARVERPDRRVVVTTPLPPQLLEGLLHAGTTPLDLDIPPP